MIIQCAWCKKVIGEKAPLNDPMVSHTICRDCSIKHFGIDPEEGKRVSMKENPKDHVEKEFITDVYNKWKSISYEKRFAWLTYIGFDEEKADTFAGLDWRTVPINVQHALVDSYMSYWKKYKKNPLEYGTGISKVKQKIQQLWDNKLTSGERKDLLKSTNHVKVITGGFSIGDYGHKYSISIIQSKFDKLPLEIQDLLIGTSYKFLKNPGAKYHTEEARTSKLASDERFDEGDKESGMFFRGHQKAHEQSAQHSGYLGMNPRKVEILAVKDTWDNAAYREKHKVLKNIGFTTDADEFAKEKYTFDKAPLWVQKALIQYYTAPKVNPGAKYHLDKATKYGKLAEQYPPASPTGSFYTGREAGHLESFGESKRLDINPKDSKKENTIKFILKYSRFTRKDLEKYSIKRLFAIADSIRKQYGLKLNPGAAWHEKQSIDHARMSNLSKDQIIKADHAGQAYAHEYSAKKAKQLGMNPTLTAKEAGEIYDELKEPDRFEILTAIDIKYYNITQVLHYKFKSLPLQIQQKLTKFFNDLESNPRKTKKVKHNPESKKVTILKNSSTGEYRVPGPAGTEAQAYYTDDRNDAVGTAKHMWKGINIVLTFKHIPDFDKFI